jgi:membrane-bound lytic murein transglycosylase B
MIRGKVVVTAVLGAVALLARLGTADAAQCGNGPAGFEGWKRAFGEEARAKGVGANAIGALMQTNYASATIAADRGQRSFSLSLDQFLAKRGATTIVARGRALKQSQAALFASIQQRYGVPPGPLIAIWGMETGFGSQRGNQNMLSSIATLAYDCRRPEFFADQLYAALKLIDRGVLSPAQRGSMHGEVGQTQFMPKNILAYGTGNLDVAANALNSTANFLKAHGWRVPESDRAHGAADRRGRRERLRALKFTGRTVTERGAQEKVADKGNRQGELCLIMGGAGRRSSTWQSRS